MIGLINATIFQYPLILNQKSLRLNAVKIHKLLCCIIILIVIYYVLWIEL
jgi:hypothetical protein